MTHSLSRSNGDFVEKNVFIAITRCAIGAGIDTTIMNDMEKIQTIFKYIDRLMRN